MAITLEAYKDLIAATLTNDTYLAERGVVFVSENKMDVASMIQQNLAQIGISGLIMTPDLQYQGQNADGYSLWSLSQLVIQISEYVDMNRARTNAVTAQDAAIRACGVMLQNFQNAMEPISIKTKEQAGFLVTNLILKTAVVVATPQPLVDVEGEEVL